MSDLQKIEEKKIKVMEPAVNTVEEIDGHIQPMDVKEVSFDKETYKVIYNENQSESITQNILSSDKALEDYYKNHDESKLKGLRSKSFLNLSGKKSERKKLRKEYLKSIGEKEVQYKALDQYITEEEEKKYNAGKGKELPAYNTNNKDEIMEIERANLMKEISADYHDLGLDKKFNEMDKAGKFKDMYFAQLVQYKKMLAPLAEKEKTNNFTRLVDESKVKLDKLLKCFALPLRI